MIPSVLDVISFLVFGICVRGQPPWASDNATAQLPPILESQLATAQALIYGYPLTQFLMPAGPLA